MPLVAAVDIGSNAVRLLTVRLSPLGRLESQDFRRYALRLGGDVFATGAVSDAKAAALHEVFDDIRQRFDALGVQRYHAVATSAMREARNGRALLLAIARRHKINIEIIDGARESALSRGALLRAVGWAPKGTLLLDLGGGSLELERTGRARGVSLPLGTVRLIGDTPALAAPMAAADLDAHIAEQARQLRLGTRMRGPVPLAVGTGGNLTFFADAAADPHALLPTIDIPRLDALARAMAPLSQEQRMARWGLRRDRAELAVAGAAVVLALAQRFGFDRLVVPGSGLREGLLHELTDPRAAAPLTSRQLRALGIAPQRARARAKLAEALFAATVPLHRLWPAALPLLHAAAALCDPDAAPRVTAVMADAASDAALREIIALATCSPRERNRRGEALARAQREVLVPLAALARLAEGLLDVSDGVLHGARWARDGLHLDVGLRGRPAAGLLSGVRRDLGVRIHLS